VIVLGDTAVLGNFAREFPFKQLGVLIGGLSLVNHTALMEIAGPQAIKGVVLTQVVPSPQREGVPIVREHVRAMKKFRDEPPSHLTLEGFIAAKMLVESLRTGLTARLVRREDVLAILTRGQQGAPTSLAMHDTGMMNTKSGKPVDVTMVRGDGTLIR
jgi:branched-chain amino acid transport system substrate-binding protein